MKPIRNLKQEDAKQTGFFKTSTTFRFLFSIIVFGLALAILLPSVLAAPPPPVVTLDAPVNYYNTSDNTTDFSFTAVSGTNATGIACTLYLNDTGHGSNSSVVNETLTTITANPEIADGFYN